MLMVSDMMLDPSENPFSDLLLSRYGIISSDVIVSSRFDSVDAYEWYTRGCPAGENRKELCCSYYVDGHYEIEER